MKILGLSLCLLLASVFHVSAQVTVKVMLDQEQFLPGEALPVSVRVVNRSGQTLRLGDQADWLKFSVEAKDGFVVLKSEEVPVKGEFVLDSSQMGTKHASLTPYFNLNQPGRYTVTATVRIKEWGREFTSDPVAFDIVKGMKLWEQEFGVPPRAGKSGAPEVRKYALQQANYLKHLKLYLRLTDASEGKVFRVFPLASMVSSSRPEPQVDKLSNLHVLCQTGMRTFTYSVINPDGEVILRQTYDGINSRPALKLDADGKFVVAGGVRRLTRDDLPATESTVPLNDVQVPKP